MISSVLSLWVCLGLNSSVTVFIWMHLFFDPFDLRCLRGVPFWKRLFRGSSQEWVNPGASNSQWLTAFWILLLAFDKFRLWRSLFECSWFSIFFHFACLRDVPFRKSLFRGSSQEWVNPGGSSSQWLAPFWIFEFALDLFRLKRSLFEWAFFSTHLLLLAYVMSGLERLFRGC